jgi:hypothetical protein
MIAKRPGDVQGALIFCGLALSSWGTLMTKGLPNGKPFVVDQSTVSFF